MNELNSWLEKLEKRTPQGNFELGLERINLVREKLNLKLNFPIITVAGTNGKGSCCCYLESILSEAGYKPGCFYSPHLISFTERIKVNGVSVTEEKLIEAFKKIEAADAAIDASGKVLSYFEFLVLAAMYCYIDANCQVVVLEVGLGGRLDATNTFDANVAVITSIGIDHIEYLGDTREKIGFEKAGIMRKDIPVIIGDSEPPESIIKHAKTLNAKTKIFKQDYAVTITSNGDWTYKGQNLRSALPRLNMYGDYQYQNAATALAALECLPDSIAINQSEVRLGLATAKMPGRFEVISGDIPIVLDVAHNVAAMNALDDALSTMGYFKHTHGIFSAYNRKDIAGMIAVLKNRFDTWHIAPFKNDKNEIDVIINELKNIDAKYLVYDSLPEAFAKVQELSKEQERIVICGSFKTVEEYLIFHKNNKQVAKK